MSTVVHAIIASDFKTYLRVLVERAIRPRLKLNFVEGEGVEDAVYVVKMASSGASDRKGKGRSEFEHLDEVFRTVLYK